MEDKTELGYYSSVNSDDTDQRLFAERLKLAYGHANTVISASLLAMVIVDFIFWEEVSREKLAVWSSLVVLTSVYGLFQIIRFGKSYTVMDNMKTWKMRFIGGNFLMGAIWGWATVAFPPADSEIHQVFMILMTGCLAAGAIATHSAIIESIFMFSIPALAPAAHKLISSQDEINYLMGWVVVLFLMFLFSSARRTSGVVNSTLKLRYENMDLLNNMQKAVLELSMAKDSLGKSEDRFRNLAEASFEGVLIVENGFVIDYNMAFLATTGYSSGELGGKKLLELVVPDYHSLTSRRLSVDHPDPFEIMLKTRNGSALPVEVRVKAANYKGAAIRVLAIRDIRERRKTEKQMLEAKVKAEEATRLKDMFVSLVAHDLKSPINSIISLLRLLRDDDDSMKDPAHRQETVGGVLETGARMVEMIDELLNMSRLRNGRIIPSYRFVRLAELVDHGFSGYEFAARRKNIAMVNEVGHEKMVYTDSDLLGQVIRNLVSNAIKFCTEGSQVRISFQDGGSPMIMVSDTGPGIDEDILISVFRHDKRIPAPGSGGERGTGLGLPFSKDIMEAMGGAISLKTSAEGTKVCLYLGAKKPRILLVDDDQATLNICRLRLSSLDVEIIEASNGSDALKLIADDQPDLIVSDVMMPGVNGFQILESTRRNEKTSNVPVIIITGEDGDKIRKKALDLGASDFISKQDAPGQLLAMVKKRIYG
ncbi:MAG: response regulator [Nitrospinota bacterium]|nr:response regulator [Nitrospinota bacterium]